ncbi:MAG: hypothetical protein K2J36_03450 [Ruminococcus sp.]|nr:hypothetical protein [Ruminococcus sp.]
MKKLLALLMACATMTCAFASCGDEGDDGAGGSVSTSDESSVSESGADKVESDNADKSDEDETSEESSEEESADDSDDTSVADDETTDDDTEKTTLQFLDDVDSSAFVGKWECEKLVVEGEEMTDFMGMPLYAVYQLDIKEDGTAVMGESFNELSDAEVSMTYEWGVISDTEIAIVNDTGDTMRFSYDGTYIIGTEEGFDEQIYFAKVDEFTPFDFEAFMNEFQEGLDDIEIDDSVFDSSSGENSDEVVDGEVSDTGESVDTVDEENVETPEESVAE